MITDIQQINSLLKSKNFFVFDFDGVIVDSVEVKTEAFHTIYKPYGDHVAKKVVEHHRTHGGMSRYEKFKYYHNNFLNIVIDQSLMSHLCNDFSRLVVKQVIESPEIKGASDFLEKLFVAKKTCIINSATPTDEITEIVFKRDLSKYFNEIFGSPASKVDNLKFVIRQYNLKLKDVLFFGDAEADLLAAECLGISFVGIGSDIYEALDKTQQNNYFLENFEEIASV